MRANGPTAYIQNSRNGLVRVALCYHSPNFLLARAQRDEFRIVPRDANHQIAHSVDAGVEDNLLTRKFRIGWSDGVTCTNNLIDKPANKFVDARILLIAMRSGVPSVRLPCNQCHHTSPNRKKE